MSTPFSRCSVLAGTVTLDSVMSGRSVTISWFLGVTLLCAKQVELSKLTRTQMPNVRACMGRLASVRAVGLGARDNLLAHLPAQCQPGIDIQLRVNERVKGRHTGIRRHAI